MKTQQLTANFNISEFMCHDGTPVPDQYECNVIVLAQNLQVLRDHLGEPITVMSGYRTPEWNARVGGAAKSQHKLAKAADLVTRVKTPKQLHTIIEKLIKDGKMKNGGLGLYKSFVHYDIGPVRRWNG
jgi:uncharacterized protein YcbK (DUF882 family)